jgi:hypothetical protein
MNFAVKDLCMFTGPPAKDLEPGSGCLLERASVSGRIRLPKIVSQMIQTDPLEGKYGHLWVKAGRLTINGSLENLVALADFR